MDRRKFLTGAAATSLAVSLPGFVYAQSDNMSPDFDIAGSADTDPAGHEIAWSADWERRTDLSTFIERSSPGVRGFIVLDIDSIPDISGSHNHRIVIETVMDATATDAESYIAALPEDRPVQEGYAPGTTIHSRHVTDRGGWICFAADVDDPTRAFRGIELFYLPETPDAPVLIVSAIDFNPNRVDYSSEALDFYDSSISVDGDWLLGMDDLDAYWQALEAVSEGS